jgi:hypothetical protein
MFFSYILEIIKPFQYELIIVKKNLIIIVILNIVTNLE